MYVHPFTSDLCPWYVSCCLFMVKQSSSSKRSSLWPVIRVCHPRCHNGTSPSARGTECIACDLGFIADGSELSLRTRCWWSKVKHPNESGNKMKFQVYNKFMHAKYASNPGSMWHSLTPLDLMTSMARWKLQAMPRGLRSGRSESQLCRLWPGKIQQRRIWRLHSLWLDTEK